jgi:hypothetical protein
MPKLRTLQKLSVEEISSEDLYTLSIERHPTETFILMKLLIPEVNTNCFPQTHKLLQLYLPTIFKSACYNDEHLPFAKEVARTELGHLFEHILLEYLCIIQLENGLDYASYEGVTNWDWTQDPKGTFHITIKAKSEELEILTTAVERTVSLMNIILNKDKNIVDTLPIPSHTTRH